MKFEVVESEAQWIVKWQGVEVARFPEQELALNEVAIRLRDTPTGEGSVSLAMRYQARA